MTKRGRGQRRNRRLKNRSITQARRAAVRHLYFNPTLWRPYDVVLAELTGAFRQTLGVA